METRTHKKSRHAAWIAPLATPRRASFPGIRTLTFALAGTLVALGVLRLVAIPGHWHMVLLTLCAAIATVWVGWLSPLVMLCADAHRLRIPGASRLALTSLFAHCALVLGMMALLFGTLEHDVAFVLTATAVAMAGGLACMLAPRWVALALAYAAAMLLALRHAWHLPPWDDPHWLLWGSVTLAALIVVDIWGWHRLVHGKATAVSGAGATLAWPMGRHGLAMDDLPQAGSSVHLGAAGPRHPRRALRIAFGGLYAPRTLATHLNTSAKTIAILGLFAAAAVMGNANTLDRLNMHASALHTGIIVAMGLLAQLAGPLAILAAYWQLRQRWQHANAERPLLALLPGLGDASRRSSNLLRAAFGTPLGWLAFSLLGPASVITVLHPHGLGALLVLCPSLVAGLAWAALALPLLAGRPPALVLEVVPAACFGVLYLYGSFLAVGYATIPHMPGAAVVQGGFLVGWLALGIVLVRAIRIGWHSYRCQLHPFLPIAA